MAVTATMLDLVSIDFLTNAWVDWSDFLVAHWKMAATATILDDLGRLIRFFCGLLGLIRGRFLSMISSAALGFGFHQLEGKRLGRLIQFLCGLLGVTRGRFLFMAAILDLVSVDFLTNAWVDWSNFLVAHWG
jgi:hypothetical protein